MIWHRRYGASDSFLRKLKQLILARFGFYVQIAVVSLSLSLTGFRLTLIFASHLSSRLAQVTNFAAKTSPLSFLQHFITRPNLPLKLEMLAFRKQILRSKLLMTYNKMTNILRISTLCVPRLIIPHFQNILLSHCEFQNLNKEKEDFYRNLIPSNQTTVAVRKRRI